MITDGGFHCICFKNALFWQYSSDRDILCSTDNDDKNKTKNYKKWANLLHKEC